MENNAMDNLTPVYTLSVTSKLSGIPVHSIRQYIDKGLLVPYKKESSRHLFSQVDISRLKYIQRQLNETGLNIAGIRSQMAMIPCWAVRSCNTEERANCQAYKSDTSPCWDASDKGPLCRNADCRECDVYSVVEDYPDIKTFIKTLIP
jgi:MerR family transcriptional regulator/heat shock protein HspR